MVVDLKEQLRLAGIEGHQVFRADFASCFFKVFIVSTRHRWLKNKNSAVCRDQVMLYLEEQQVVHNSCLEVCMKLTIPHHTLQLCFIV
jgi:hypothetical protein